MSVTKEFNVLGLESLPFTRCLVLKAIEDLTDTTNAEAMEFHAVLPANCLVTHVVLDVVTPPKDASDSAFDDVTITVGDSGSATVFIPSKQIAALNGSPVKWAAMDRSAAIGALTFSSTPTQAEANALRSAIVTAVKGKEYLSADYLKVVVTPKSGKNLANLDIGEIRIYVALLKEGELG